jgi:hypothetical protein
MVKTETETEALEVCPWAAIVEPVEGGMMCFESADEYDTWTNQK